LIDQCNDFPDWQRKIEEEVGGQISMLYIQIDESVRDTIVLMSPNFMRFVSHIPFKK
jgi:hypothetical protein